MDAAQQERLGELFEHVQALSARERATFLDETYRGDPVLHAELISLLASYDEAPDYLEQLAGEVLPAALGAFVEEAPEEIPAGQRIAHYEVLGRLGSGGMGVVYKAYDRRLDRLVALKFLPGHLAADDAAKVRLIYEARAASALDHPNICTVYDIGETEGRLFLALACYEGETLKQRIARGPRPVNEVLEQVRQVTDGLRAAHRRGIIHRDIKPSNVMLTGEGAAKILDFGIAKVEGTDLLKEGRAAGTIAYMSPEQTRGEAVDGRTDLWSLGVVLYEMLTGRQPFRGEDIRTVINAIRYDEPEPVQQLRPEVPALLARLVETCLKKAPAERYQRAVDVLADLRAIETRSTAGGERSPQFRRLAVLPLSNFSPNPDDDYLAGGMTEDLIDRLSKLRGVRVIARTSVKSYKDATENTTKIGRELDVKTLLKGSVRKIGDQVHLTIHLVDTNRNERTWAAEHSVVLEDVPTLLQSIAQTVASELHEQIPSNELRQLVKTGTDVPEAYTSYLRGRYFWNKRDGASVQQARAYFQQALDLDPTFARAWTGLADAFSLLGSLSVLPPEEAHPRARAAARKALEIDDELAEAHASLATTLADYYWDWEAAGQHYRRALALNPSYATAHLWFAGYLRDLGNFDEALAEVRMARELDPLYLPAQAAEGLTLHFARRYEEAIALHLKLLDINPSYTIAHFYLGLSYVQQGRFEETIAALHRAETRGAIVPDVKGLFGYTYARMGNHTEARKMLRELDQLANEKYAYPFHRAMIYVGLNEKDHALEYLEKACEERVRLVRLMNVDPFFDPLRPDPRFRTLVEQVGLLG